MFHGNVEFSFTSLSPAQLRDFRTYARRKWRYARGALQHQMLVRLLERDGMGAVPRHVNDLYHEGPLPSRRAWTGRDTLFGLLAVLWIRSFRRRAPRAERYTPAVR